MDRDFAFAWEGKSPVPRLSDFYGIVIYMYYRDHAPPHFHAIYGEHEATIDIATGATLEGSLPRRAKNLVEDWLTLHRQELLLNWNLATQQQPLNRIDPLD